MGFFTESDRNAIYQRIVAIGKSDERISGGALVGSFALNKQDSWSDIDISFGVETNVEPIVVLDEWTNQLQSEFEIVHYFDVPRSEAIYRVILFSSGIEVDLSVVPKNDFGPKSPKFKLLFGQALEENISNPSIEDLYGWAWHHVMHANASINRGKLWQAEFWISNLREHLISLKCLRKGLPHLHGRGVDQLAEIELQNLDKTLLKSIETDELKRALTAAAEVLIKEIEYTNPNLSKKLLIIFKKALGEGFTNNSVR